MNDLPLEVLLGIPPELRIVKEEPEDDVEMEIDELSAEARRERRAGKQKEVIQGSVAPSRSSRSMTAGPSKRKSASVAVEYLPLTPSVESRTPAPAPAPDSRPPSSVAESFTFPIEPLLPTPVVESFAFPPDPPPARAPTPPLADQPPAKRQRIASPIDSMDDVQLGTGFFEDLTAIDANRPVRTAPIQKDTSQPKKHSRLKQTPRLVETSRSQELPRPVEPSVVEETPRLVEPSPVEEASRLVEPSPVVTSPPPPETPRPADVEFHQEIVHAALTQPVRESVQFQPADVSPSPAPPPRYTCPEQFPAHRPPAVPAAHIIFTETKVKDFPESRDVPSTFPSDLLTSFVMLESDEELISDEELNRRAQHQVDIKRKVAALRELGLTATGQSPTKNTSSAVSRPQGPPTKGLRSHHTLLVDDALRRRAHLLREEKQKSSQLKKIVKAVNSYWSGLASAEERRIKEEERKLKALARDAAKAIRAKWKLAVNVSLCQMSGVSC